MQRLLEIIKEERSEEDHRELPCRDFDWDCLALDGVIPFESYIKCQMYDQERGKCLFVKQI
jgi:hypothetical protein